MLKRAVNDPVWEVYMVGFHMMHQGARRNVFPVTRAKGIGTLLMFAVRSIFADPPRVAREMKELADKGLVEKWLGESDDPLGFLIHEGGAANLTEAAYRFARHEPGVDVVLFGTGDAGHLRSNVEALLKPPLPEADREKLSKLFGHLTGDRPQFASGSGLEAIGEAARQRQRAPSPRLREEGRGEGVTNSRRIIPPDRFAVRPLPASGERYRKQRFASGSGAYFSRFAASWIRLRSECFFTSTLDLKMPRSTATSTFFCSATRSGIMSGSR